LFISKLALVLILCYIVATSLLVWRSSTEVFAPASAVGTENGSAAEMAYPAQDSAEDWSVIVRRSIFGAAGKPSSGMQSEPGRADVGFLPSASHELGLELVGTVCGSPPFSRAIVRDTKTKTVDLYRPGQTVAGAYIQSIEDNVVILIHEGRRKMLSLKTAEAGAPANAAKNANDAAGGIKPAAYLPPTRISEQPAAVNTSRIGYIEEILSKAVIEPYTVNGKVEGLKITGLEDVPVAGALGLKNGDIIRMVNGQQLTSIQKAFQVFQKAKSQPAINLELSRGDETKELTFDLQ
jgi:general secretion pathway protein C